MTAKKKPWKKKAAAAGVLVAAILALLVARCSGGFGFGKGDGSAEPESTSSAVQPVAGSGASEQDVTAPCNVRVTAGGVTVNGATCADGEVARCCTSTRAQLTITGDARQGDADSVRAQLHAGAIEILERKPAATP